MTDTRNAMASQRKRRRIDWIGAVRALYGLAVGNENRAELASRLGAALEGRSILDLHERFFAHAGGRALRERASTLLDAIRDREALRALPPESFGYAYACYMDQERIDGETLARTVDDAYGPEEEELHFVRARMRDSHDLWHALTGYGADPLGEGAIVAFSMGQVRQNVLYALGALMLAAPMVLLPRHALAWPRYMFQAYRRGRRAAWLLAEPLEDLLPLPLDEVRRRLGILPPWEAHPQGLFVGDLWKREARRVRVAPHKATDAGRPPSACAA
jgi:ubiquinone biosynthesis protein COQ4